MNKNKEIPNTLLGVHMGLGNLNPEHPSQWGRLGNQVRSGQVYYSAEVHY